MENVSNLSSMIGKMVQIDRGGPESRIGRLLSAKKDHLVIHPKEEGILYYKIDHIKSCTINTKDYSDLSKELENPIQDYFDVEDFGSILKSMKHRWVRINRGGPESIEGVLIDVFDNNIFIVVNNEVISIFNFHIRNISYGLLQEKKEEKEKQDEKESKKDDNKQKDDGKNKQKDDGKNKQKDDGKNKQKDDGKNKHKDDGKNKQNKGDSKDKK